MCQFYQQMHGVIFHYTPYQYIVKTNNLPHFNFIGLNIYRLHIG